MRMKSFPLFLFLVSLFYINTANAQLNTPTLISPSNNATNQSETVTFSWYGYPGASDYTFEISTNSTFPVSTTFVQYNISGTSLKYSGLSASTTYYWRVKADLTAGGSTSFCYPFEFTTGDKPTAKIGMMSATICTNTAADIYSASTGLMPMSYLWTINGATISNPSSSYPNIYFTSPGTYTIKLSVSNAFGASSAIDYIKVVDAISGVSISRNGNSTKCLNNEVTLTANPSGMYYSWSNGATTQSIKVKDSGNYIVSVSNGTCSLSATERINYDSAALQIVASANTICAGDSVKLDAGSGYAKYIWSTGEISQTIYAKKSGVYKITAISTDSCIFTGSDTIKYRYADVFKINTLGLTNGKTCAGTSIGLFVPKLPELKKLRWSTGDTGTSITISSPGKYNITATDVNGCTAFAEINLNYNTVKCMSGKYTIGGTVPDFRTIQDAIKALKSSLVSGEITFNIRNGSYSSDDVLVLDSIERLDGNHRIIFQSESGNASKVKIYNSNKSASKDVNTIFIRAGYLTFRNLTIYASNYGMNRGQLNEIINVFEKSPYIELIGNTFIDSSRFYSTTLVSISSTGGNILNNTFLGGYIGLRIEPSIGKENALVKGNKFAGQEHSMINSTASGVKIIDNFNIPFSQSYRTAIAVDIAGDGFVVSGNKFTNYYNSTTNILNTIDYGIWISTFQNDSVVPLVVNNVISVSTAAMNISETYALKIYHNNLYGFYYGIYLAYSYQYGLDIQNNIVSEINSASKGYSITAVKTNNYYPNNTSQFSSIPEIANLDGNSLSEDPLYFAEYKPYYEPFTKNSKFNKAGTVISSVTTDFHGRPRDMNNADIGAEEINPNHDLSLDTVYIESEKCGFTAAENLKFQISNQSTIYNETIPAGAGNITFGYKLDNNTAVTLNANLSAAKSIASLDSQVMIYMNKLDLSAPGLHAIRVWVNLSGDSNRSNDTLKLAVTAKEKPVAQFDFENVCFGNTTSFVNKTVYTASDIQYMWIVSDGTMEKTKDIVKAFTKAGNYTVKLIAISATGCKDSITKTITISPNPVATITRNWKTLTATSGGKSYQWLQNGILINGATSQSYIVTKDDKYAVIMTNNADCSDTSNEYNFIYTGLAEEDISSEIEIYPNPSQGKTLITGIQPKTKLNTIYIYDILGKCVYTESTKSTQGNNNNNNIELDLSSLKAGVYWLKLTGENSEANKKLIIY